jgi:hypothetical protein
MKKRIVYANSQLRGGNTYECDRLDLKLRRLMENKEPIDEEMASMIYTERKDGVLPAYNIRTDRFDVAIMAMDAANKMRDAQRWQGMESSTEPTAKGEEPTTTPADA